MTSYMLKIIAIITMAIDHTGDAFFKQISFMNLIGRIAFPIFAFQISEGYIHSKNLKKYFLRLFLFAIISQVPFALFASLYTQEFTLNIFFTLFTGLLAIFIYDKIIHNNFKFISNEKVNMFLKECFALFTVIILAVLAELFHFDYGFFGIAIIFLFYIFKNSKIEMAVCFIIACILKYTHSIILYGYSIWYVLCGLFTILPIIFICLYNKKQGKKVKYLLYFFYPVHLLILYFLFR